MFDRFERRRWINLAEWGIAAYHSGRWVAERESDAMGPFARKGGNGAATGYLASNSTSSCLNDADIARRVSEYLLIVFKFSRCRSSIVST